MNRATSTNAQVEGSGIGAAITTALPSRSNVSEVMSNALDSAVTLLNSTTSAQFFSAAKSVDSGSSGLPSKWPASRKLSRSNPPDSAKSVGSVSPRKLQIVFSFLGDTDPTAFAASGGFDLDNFLLAGHFDGRLDDPLSKLFASGQTWDDVVDFGRVSAESSVFNIASLTFDGATGGVGVIAAPIPEPTTWALMLVGVLVIASRARALRRGARTSRGHVTACS